MMRAANDLIARATGGGGGEPANVDSPTNPPASYGKARWHSWAAWKGKVKDALFAITGQRFSTGKEAKAWLKENARKLK